MPNHIHLILRIKSGDGGRMIRLYGVHGGGVYETMDFPPNRQTHLAEIHQNTAKDGDSLDLQKRKPNRIVDYDYSQNGAYFITVCTQDRRPILSTIVGGGALDAPLVVLTQIGEIVRRNLLSGNRIAGLTVDKYVIMPDHIHFILMVDKTAAMGTSRAPSPTNAAVPHFVSTFKRFCHRDIGAVIFQRSYYDHVIRNQRDYEEIWEYIENNPRKWVMQNEATSR